jgi:LPPG:FO 2-phospho-L-lactate transferase
MLAGMQAVVDPGEIVGIVNTGDDTELHGLYISPDLDTITYTLAGVVNPATGWGLAGESFRAMQALERFDAVTWFRLGDGDLATHLYRTGRMRGGATLSEVTAEISRAWGLGVRLLPMSDDPVRTRLRLDDELEVAFQEYFVKLRHSVVVESVRFEGAETARPAPGVLDALESAEIDRPDPRGAGRSERADGAPRLGRGRVADRGGRRLEGPGRQAPRRARGAGVRAGRGPLPQGLGRDARDRPG